jgi:hypothetical protein
MTADAVSAPAQPIAPEPPEAPARRPEKRQREKFVAVRCTDAEHAALTERATRAGLSVGAYLRAAGLGAPGIRSARRPPVEKVALAQALGLLGRYGGNLNQLAHAANAAGALPTLAELGRLAGEVRELRAALMQALGRGGADGD